MKKEQHTYPDKILPTVISDMMCYHKHGYSFADFCDRNTHGRNYGRELFPVWEETKARYDAEHDTHGTGAVLPADQKLQGSNESKRKKTVQKKNPVRS